MHLHEGMAWNDVRSMNLGDVPKITSSYGFNKAWVTEYDDPAIFRPRAAVFTDPMTRFPRSPIPTSLDGYDEAVEDGSGSDDGPVKACKKRKLTLEQTKTLEISFEADNKLEGEKKLQLAKELGLQPRQVAVWFQNRRARWKTKRLEQEYAALKSGYDAILEKNKSLQAEVERLTAERQSGINPLKSNVVGESISSESHGIKLETLLSPASIKPYQLASPEPELTTRDVKPTKASSSRDQSVTSTTNSETNYSDVMDEESLRGGDSCTRATVKLEGEKQSNAGDESRKRWTDMANSATDCGQEYDDDAAIVLNLEEMNNYQSSYETVEPYVDLFGDASEHHLWYFNSL